MTRKLLVKIIATFYLAQGLWDIGAFFLPMVTSPSLLSLNLFTVVVGALELWAGIYLLQLSEFGRKYTIVLLALRMAYNFFFIVWAFLQSDFSFTINYFNRQIFESKSIYPFVFTLLAWSLIALFAIIFLGQKQTKAIFISRSTSAENDRPISESVSNQ
jgi:hypothetical protein